MFSVQPFNFFSYSLSTAELAIFKLALCIWPEIK